MRWKSGIATRRRLRMSIGSRSRRRMNTGFRIVGSKSPAPRVEINLRVARLEREGVVFH